MKLIADIGATTSRFLVEDNGTVTRFNRPGYNAVTHERKVWQDALASLEIDHDKPIDAYLFGAGFYTVTFPIVAEDFKNAFPKTGKLHIESDLAGACRGLAKDKEAIVVIMGTGSNSCRYDGDKIVKNIEPMGFILGDEGNAGSIGRAMIRAVIRKKMPQELADAFRAAYPQFSDIDLILGAHQSQGNQFMGQFAKFAHAHIDHPFMQEAVTKPLTELFDLLQEYQAPHLTHYFTGSIAAHFDTIVTKLCDRNGIKNYKIVPDYLDGIAEFYDAK